MDESEIYYTALVLDPRVKGDLISRELEDKEASDLILEAIRNNLHKKYRYDQRIFKVWTT